MTRHIGIYPGTFDPLHQGHIAFGKASLHQCGLDEVIFTPEKRPRGKTEVTPLSHRRKQLDRVIGPLKNLGVTTLTSEQFTVQATLPELRQLYHDAHFTFLLGSDVARTLLHRWDNLETLLTSASFAIGMRDGDARGDIEAVFDQLEADYRVQLNYTLIRTEHAGVSSSQLRGGGYANRTI